MTESLLHATARTLSTHPTQTAPPSFVSAIPASIASQYETAPSFEISDPLGQTIRIPATAEEDFAYFRPDQEREIAQYYREYGYVLIRGLLPAQVCQTAMERFEAEVKPSRRYIYRQTTANPERNVETSEGFVVNPILNIQSLPVRHFGSFRDAGLAAITHRKVQALVAVLLGERGKLVQSMYFQGNSATWAHQDTYYLDAERIGGMVAGWFAMEDIAPGAGRFYVYPKSHLINMAKNGGEFDIAFNHDRYKRVLIDVIRRHGLECRAPALQQGDVLFWSSKTIHGSLGTTQPARSRSSFTAHYIPDSARFLQFQSRIKPLNLQEVQGMRVHHPKDQNRLVPRMVLWVETTFPKTFQTAKKIAIKALTR